MRGYLLDTNVVSELRKKERCDAGVTSWFAGVETDQLHLSVLVVGELRRGVELVRARDPISARHLEVWLTQLRSFYRDSLLPVTEDIAELWGEMGLKEPIPPIDGLLAATALFHDLTIVTRNIADFERTPIETLNPFS